MEKLLKTGKTKAIGVSNYSVKFLQELLPQCSVVPAANQIENHPYLPQQDIADFCKEKGILIEAYSPLGSTGSPLFNEEGVQEIAKKLNVGPGTVLLSYQGMLCPAFCWMVLTICSLQGSCRASEVRDTFSYR
jgi:glycerol 2-dehydrogenase (NADP+)